MEAGERSTFFCFIISGVFEVWVQDTEHNDQIANEITTGEYCGEIGILFGVRRTASVKAVKYCTVGVISARVFNEMTKCSEELRLNMKKRIARLRDPYKRQITKTLRRIPYLRQMPSEEIDEVFYAMEIQEFKTDSLVFQSGALCNQFYIVLQGKVGLYMTLYDSNLIEL